MHAATLTNQLVLNLGAVVDSHSELLLVPCRYTHERKGDRRGLGAKGGVSRALWKSRERR